MSARSTPIARRDFLRVTATAAGGLLIAVTIPGCGSKEEVTRRASASWRPNAFLRLDPDGSITVTVSRQEMGQGVRTSLPMLVAEELGADWRRIRVEQADLDEARYGEQYTGGSATIRTSWTPLRKAGAAARVLLVEAAARRWGVPPGECRAEAGTIVHRSTERRLEFAALLDDAATLTPPADPALKDPSEFVLIGHRTRHVDVPAIVTGRTRFGLDTRVPGMLFATIERSPAFGGRVAGVDDAAARSSAGVRDVVVIDAAAVPDFGENNPKMPDGVAVVAESTWAALRGRRALRVDWHEPAELAATATMRRQAAALADRPRWRYRDDGDVDAAFRDAAHVLDAVYEVPLLAHAPMEPMNAVADVRTDTAEVWVPCQNPQYVRDAVARVTGFAPDRIDVHPTRMGGAFGRRFYADYAAEAAYVSRAVKAPVQVVWTREDETRHGFYRPAGYQVLRGAFDADGRIVAWRQHCVNASRGHYLRWRPPPGRELRPGEVGRDDFPASFIPNLRIEYTPLESAIPRGQWRSVEESMNVFVNQSFLAELGHAAGKDPLQTNLELLAAGPADVPYYGSTYAAKRLVRVFRLAAERSGWGEPLPARWGRGIAGSYSNGAFCAQVADVEVTPNGQVRVHRIVAAVDGGTVINPSGAEAQVQGAIIFALSAALKQEITVENGRVVQGNFDDFDVLRLDETPRIDVHLVPSTEPPSGLGEVATGQTAPAVAEAIFRASGKRVRRLPVEAEALRS